MHHRFTQTLVIFFWLISMTWLVSTKMIPTWRAPSAPDQRAFRPEQGAVNDARWAIHWNQRPVGFATSQTRRDSMGFGQVESIVHFENLSTKDITRELFGNFGLLMRMIKFEQADVRLTMTVQSVMEFDPFGELERFSSSIESDGVGELVKLTGRVDDSQLTVQAFTGEGFLGDSSPSPAIPEPIITRKIDLPAEAQLADLLMPQRRLAGVRVGQSWTFDAYRAFPPQNPFRRMKATVIERTTLPWQGEPEPVMVVLFDEAAGSGLTTAQQATSRLWVRKDGTVLRQEMRLGNATIAFLREFESSPATETNPPTMGDASP